MAASSGASYRPGTRLTRAGIPTRSGRPWSSLPSRFDGQVGPVAPLVPRAVVVGPSGRAQPRQVEQDDGRRDPAIAVGDRGPVRPESSFLDPPADLLDGEETAFGGEEEL